MTACLYWWLIFLQSIASGLEYNYAQWDADKSWGHDHFGNWKYTPGQNMTYMCPDAFKCMNKIIHCPPHLYCWIVCKAGRSCSNMQVRTYEGTKLHFQIATVSGNPFGNDGAQIFCPPDDVHSDGYLSGGQCKIEFTVPNSTVSLSNFQIIAMESFNNLEIVGQNCGPKCQATLYCGQDLESECTIKPDLTGEWSCTDENAVCANYLLPSLDPTTDPTQSPTTFMPTFSPTKYNPNNEPPISLYVDANSRCDYGYCGDKPKDFDVWDLGCSIDRISSSASQCCTNQQTTPSNLQLPTDDTGCNGYPLQNAAALSKCYDEECKYTVTNTMTITDDSVFTNSVMAYEMLQSSTESIARNLCFNVSDVICWEPRIVSVEYEAMVAKLTQKKWLRYYQNMRVAYNEKATKGNSLNDEECKGWAECGDYFDCPLDRNLEDEYWLPGGIYSFWADYNTGKWENYDQQCSSPRRNLNMRVSVQCSSTNDPSTCKSFKYTYNCLLGRGGIPNDDGCAIYDGNGRIKMAKGRYEFDEEISIKDRQIMIEGDGMSETWLDHYDGRILCNFRQCHFRMKKLTYIMTTSADFVVTPRPTTSPTITTQYGSQFGFRVCDESIDDYGNTGKQTLYYQHSHQRYKCEVGPPSVYGEAYTCDADSLTPSDECAGNDFIQINQRYGDNVCVAAVIVAGQEIAVKPQRLGYLVNDIAKGTPDHTEGIAKVWKRRYTVNNDGSVEMTLPDAYEKNNLVSAACEATTKAPSRFPSNSPTSSTTSAPTRHPTTSDCVSSSHTILDTKSFTNWQQKSDGITPTSSTFTIANDMSRCKEINPCIKIIGNDNDSALGRIYVEQSFNSADWKSVRVKIEGITNHFDDENKMGFFETVCNEVTQTEVFNANKLWEAPYSECYTRDTMQCDTLLIRIGAYISGTGDEFYLSQIKMDPHFITLEPTLEPTINPTQYPTIEPTMFPTMYPTIEPTMVPTLYPLQPTQAPNYCFTSPLPYTVIDTSSFDEWQIGCDPCTNADYPMTNETVTLINPETTSCTARHGRFCCWRENSQCIAMRGTGKWNTIYVEKVINSSAWQSVKFSIDGSKGGKSWAGQHGKERYVFEALCGDDVLKTSKGGGTIRCPNGGVICEWSQCVEVNVEECDLLTIRVGGLLEHTNDLVYIAYVAYSPTALPLQHHCLTDPFTRFGTNSFNDWQLKVDGNDAQTSQLSAFAIINKEVRVQGFGGGLRKIYVEQSVDVFGWHRIKIAVDGKSVTLNDVNDRGFIETVCNDNTLQMFEFNRHIDGTANFSECFDVNTALCDDELLLRVGGFLSSELDFIYISDVAVEYLDVAPPTTAMPTLFPSDSPTLLPTPAPTMIENRIEIINGGNAIFEEVEFRVMSEYNATEKLRFYISDYANAQFIDCVFSAPNTQFYISNHANVTFERCDFVNIIGESVATLTSAPPTTLAPTNQPTLRQTTSSPTSPPTIATTFAGDYYWIVAGRRDHTCSINNAEPECTQITSKQATIDPGSGTGIGYTCCDKNGKGSRDGCTKNGAYSYDDAVKKCANAGKVLCTREQIANGAGKGEGCSFDCAMVWSSTKCQGPTSQPTTSYPTQSTLAPTHQPTWYPTQPTLSPTLSPTPPFVNPYLDSMMSISQSSVNIKQSNFTGLSQFKYIFDISEESNVSLIDGNFENNEALIWHSADSYGKIINSSIDDSNDCFLTINNDATPLPPRKQPSKSPTQSPTDIPSLAPTFGDYHWIIEGDGNDRRMQKEIYHPARCVRNGATHFNRTEGAVVLWDGIRYTCCDENGKGSRPECKNKGYSFYTAKSICEKYGRRLCTRNDIKGPNRAATGSTTCDAHKTLIWTSDPCIPDDIPTSKPTKRPTHFPTPSPTLIPTAYHTKCVSHFDGDLFIDNVSASVQNVRFGHSINSDFDVLSLHVFDISPIEVYESVDFADFNEQNGLFVFEPCDPFIPGQVDTLLFDDYAKNNDLSATHVYTEVAGFDDELFICGDYSLCFVVCESKYTCFRSQFISNATEKFLLKCSDDRSCQDSNILIADAKYAAINCDFVESCQEMQIFVDNVEEFVLECVEREACNELLVNVSKTERASINCYFENSCKGMKIWSDTNDIFINIHHYNEGMNVLVPSAINQNALNCDPNNATLRLNGRTYSGSLQQATNELFDGKMPCEDVIFSFTQSDKVDCQIRYEFIQNDEVDERINDLTNMMQCFPPIYVSDITSYDCFGSKAPTSSPSLAPTLAPTPSPSQAPTQSPTGAPTTFCPAIFVNVNDNFKNFDWIFDGLYPYDSIKDPDNGMPFWKGPDDGGKYVKYVNIDTWRIKGNISTAKEVSIEIIDNKFLQHIASQTPMIGTYSQDKKNYVVTIKCILTASPTSAPSFSPTIDPTNDPTVYPTTDPTLGPTEDPTIDPTADPTINPTKFPTTDPSSSPSQPPTSAPSVAPSFGPSQAPTTPPTSAPTTFCPAIYVNVNDQFYDFDSLFEGLYTLDGFENGAPYWEVPQLKNEKYLKYGDNDIWRLYGQKDKEGNVHYLEIEDSSFLQNLKLQESEPTGDWLWTYSNARNNEKFSVSIKCIATASPTAAPTTAPTFSPTAAPSNVPTGNPTQDPTSDPTADPTSKPTADPTEIPSIDPTKYPSADPTQEPTVDPTIDPTKNPSSDPTIDPTQSPTESPSKAPSQSPSNAPSQAPSKAPTRVPTLLSEYDAGIDVYYYLHGVSERDISTFAFDHDIMDTLEDVKNMIEYAYVKHGLEETGSGQWLNFYEFYVEILELNKLSITYIEETYRADIDILQSCDNTEPCLFEFKCKIHCFASVCSYLLTRYEKMYFEAMMTESFKHYLNVNAKAEINENLRFEAIMGGAFLNNPPEDEWYKQPRYWIYMIVAALLIAMFLFYCFYKYRIKWMRRQKSLKVTNALVLCVAIGKYEKPENEIDNEVNGTMCDLDGVQHDVDHMQDLFGTRLNYDVFPKLISGQAPPTTWNENDLKMFFEKGAKYLSNNIGQGKFYDALVCVISCHGLSGYICTSDYKLYSKVAIHRSLSLYSNLREIPRFILYDCCQGANSIEQAIEPLDDVVERHKSLSVSPKSAQNETEKKIEEEDVQTGQQWIYGQENPDHLLGRVNAANEGFVSRLDTRFGSYVIHSMYEKYVEAFDKRQSPFIHEIFDSIQRELQQAGKQMPEVL